MKRPFLLAVAFFSIGLAVAPMAQASDTVFDKASDWFATLGKDDSEKQMILAERRAGRAARQLEKSVSEGARKTGKGLKEMGKDMERSLD
ncbi:MAG TPA: hypothetical protein VL404_01780 [Candidatus Eisenbacteria bacterium]|nr:hypothetical protein [Candidatus Eisenbacteria bacterium]